MRLIVGPRIFNNIKILVAFDPLGDGRIVQTNSDLISGEVVDLGSSLDDLGLKTYEEEIPGPLMVWEGQAHFLPEWNTPDGYTEAEVIYKGKWRLNLS